MAYGASARRVPAKGDGNVNDADIYKLGIVGKFKRGLASVQTEIFTLDDLRKKCGNMRTDYYSPLVLKAFFEHLQSGVSVEVKVKQHVASDAVQAAYSLMDTAGSPVKIFDVKAGLRGEIDQSAGGNDFAIKTLRSENVTFKLTANTAATPVIAYLDQVNNLEVGYQVKIADGTNTEYPFITAIDRVNKSISFSALTNTYTAALTTVSRLDWNLYIAVKDDFGIYQQVEEYLDIPFVKSNTLGMAGLTNDVNTGSFYVILTLNAGNTTVGVNARPGDLTTWTPLANGSDGTAPNDASWNTAVASLADESMQILLSPESTSTTHNNNMAVWSTNGYKAMYYGQASNGADEEDLKNIGAIVRGSVIFGMLPMDKWMRVADPTKEGATIDIPPVGHAAAFWFNSYSVNGAARVAAGNRDTMLTSDILLDSNGLVHDDRNGVGQRLIEKYSANIARFRRGKGITINSARTFSTDPGYIFQNQIMQWLLYKASILEYLRSIEQDKAGVRAQEAHKNAITAYLLTKYKAGDFFQGQKEDGSPTKFEDVCIVINDFTVNTLANIANGIEETFFQFIASPPIEKPILSLASAAATAVRA